MPENTPVLDFYLMTLMAAAAQCGAGNAGVPYDLVDPHSSPLPAQAAKSRALREPARVAEAKAKVKRKAKTEEVERKPEKVHAVPLVEEKDKDKTAKAIISPVSHAPPVPYAGSRLNLHRLQMYHPRGSKKIQVARYWALLQPGQWPSPDYNAKACENTLHHTTGNDKLAVCMDFVRTLDEGETECAVAAASIYTSLLFDRELNDGDADVPKSGFDTLSGELGFVILPAPAYVSFQQSVDAWSRMRCSSIWDYWKVHGELPGLFKTTQGLAYQGTRKNFAARKWVLACYVSKKTMNSRDFGKYTFRSYFESEKKCGVIVPGSESQPLLHVRNDKEAFAPGAPALDARSDLMSLYFDAEAHPVDAPLVRLRDKRSSSKPILSQNIYFVEVEEPDLSVQ